MTATEGIEGTPAATGRSRRHPKLGRLPTGTVTFLFSDIEGSTRLVNALGPKFGAVLERHQALLRGAVQEAGGLEIATEGDSFFVVFAHAAGAVNAAIGAQRAIAQERWPTEVGTLRVRMGLHTGEGVLGGDNYVGLDVHRAARIMAAAHGGQVLLSDSTRSLVAGSLPAAVDLRDLGEHRLKDLTRPERLFQLVAPGLDEAFPPPRSMSGPSTLPAPLTSFVGRDGELERVWEASLGARLVTLTGPGGTGKSRLAIEVGRRHRDAFPDGVHFVALEALHDPILVPSAILQALGLREEGRRAEEVLNEQLATKQLMLVLDNFEQVRSAAGFVGRLLVAAPDVRVLVTSRVPLAIGGEHEYPVGPLKLPDAVADVPIEALLRFEAVRLFVDRARAVQPSFALGADNAESVLRICARLDGLPLAIELAAARVKLLSPDAILARIEGRLDLLTTQSPDLPPRQRSLRGAIEWSIELLSEPEQRLFERLAAFSGGWDLAAAEAIGDPAALGLELLDGVASLLDQSLIVRVEEREARFSMLQTIREFGRERLDAIGDAALTDRRHATYFRDLAESVEAELVGSDPARAVGRLVRDQDNLRAALDWALKTENADLGIRLAAALWRFWQESGQLREGRRWLDTLLSLPAAQDDTALRSRGLTAAGGIAYWQGDVAARDYYRRALEGYRTIGDRRGEADALQNLAFSVMSVEVGEGTRLFRESLARYRELGDERNIASVVGALGYGELISGHLPEARAALEEALALNLAHGVRARANDNRVALGHVHRLAGDLDAARNELRSAVADTKATGDAARMLMQLDAVVVWASAAGHHREALRLAAAAERARDEHGGSISIPIPDRIDPVVAARASATVDEVEIAAASTEGRELDLAAAVEAALLLLDGS